MKLPPDHVPRAFLEGGRTIVASPKSCQEYECFLKFLNQLENYRARRFVRRLPAAKAIPFQRRVPSARTLSTSPSMSPLSRHACTMF